MRLIALAALTLAAAIAGPAFAGQPVTLKMDVTVEGPVTLGDLFDGASPGAAKIIIAPAVTADTLTLDVAAVQRAALRAGLDWPNAQGIRRIVVHGGLTAPATTAATTAIGGATAATPGPAKPAGNVQVLAYTHALDAGEIVTAEDLTWAKAVQSPAGAPRDADQLIGKQVRRPLREGAIANTHDVTSPMVIKKDDMISVTFAQDGISLVMQGKAVTSAAVGDTLGVLNTSTKQTIQAVAASPGHAVIGPEADRLRALALAGSQLASR